MRKIIYLADFILFCGVVLMAILLMNSCEKTTEVFSRKHKPSLATTPVYYSPDDSLPYSCWTQCTITPNPSGISYVSNSGQVLQVGLDSLPRSNQNYNYADSIEYALKYNGAVFAVWTEKWCNTNGCYIYESTATAPPNSITIEE